MRAAQDVSGTGDSACPRSDTLDSGLASDPSAVREAAGYGHATGRGMRPDQCHRAILEQVRGHVLIEDDAMSATSEKHRPAVSVVIPTFNRIDLLPLAVSSVLDQTFADFELLVVDDGSTDGTDSWLDAITDRRLRAIRLPHSGNVARVRNAGAAAATGRFLAFLDSDDLWLPRKLEAQMATTATDERAWSYTRYEHIDAGGWRIPPRAGA